MRRGLKNSVPEIEVGILSGERIRVNFQGAFRMRDSEKRWSGALEAVIHGERIELNGEENHMAAGREVLFYPSDTTSDRFIISEVVIGIGFHWEQKEDLKFQGALKMMISGHQIQIVNLVKLEDYLISVISSEMRGDSSPALLEAHTIISRSWLLAQIEKRYQMKQKHENYEMIHRTEKEFIRWYDREDHHDFHVCADDHCQRYQGITRVQNRQAEQAVNKTHGQVLVYKGQICDARFSKCCGGVAEEFEYCWEPVAHPYLKRVDDNPAGQRINTADLKVEANAVAFIESSPPAFCNTRDRSLLRQVLNDYDYAFSDFFRWEVRYNQTELADLIHRKSGIDFGVILDLVPMERGESGRLVRLKVVGSRKILTIGKELEIRRWLSESHLYSAAFTVEKRKVNNGIPEVFVLHGAGWGHGVGLCQIGAAVMASQGYTCREILSHYFRDTNLEKRYE